MELSRSPEVKAKLLAALETVMPDRFKESGSVDAGRELMSKLFSLEYLSWCIKEVMRLWPVLAGGPLRDLTEDVHHNGMLLPKGSTDEFVPERWGAQNPQPARLKETVNPFSLGRRSCLG